MFTGFLQVLRFQKPFFGTSVSWSIRFVNSCFIFIWNVYQVGIKIKIPQNVLLIEEANVINPISNTPFDLLNHFGNLKNGC